MTVISQLVEADQEEILEHLISMEETSEDVKVLTKQLGEIDLVMLKEQLERAREGNLDEGDLIAVDGELRGGWKSDEVSKKEWEKIGLDAIKKGSVAVLLLAGGQGTRLGSSLPKALYDLGLPSRKTLLELQAERILSLSRLANAPSLPWYIMASPSTQQPIEDALSQHSCYGLNPEEVTLFTQGTLPCLSQEGHLLLASPSMLADSPDGNGGLYSALERHSILEDMKSRGVKHIFLYCVDNVLVKVADPLFLGFCIKNEAEAGNKIVERREGESVGVTGLLGGHKPTVLEYSESGNTSSVPDANICIHYFSIDFLLRAVDREYELPLHIANKKVPHWDPKTGLFVKPTTPNAIKLEKFIFDSFRFCPSEKFAVFEVLRNEEFAPLKSKEGKEGTPELCKEAIVKLHTQWILKAGGDIIDDDNRGNLNKVADSGEDDSPEELKEKNYLDVEISPLVSYWGEGLEKLIQGRTLVPPLLLTENKTYF